MKIQFRREVPAEIEGIAAHLTEAVDEALADRFRASLKETLDRLAECRKSARQSRSS
jgi:plasmid stabilization system protein ParE